MKTATERTVGERAVNHFASFEMSIELLQPVPDAIGELLEYTDNCCISVLRIDLLEI